MQCPACGYIFEPFETACPHCALRQRQQQQVPAAESLREPAPFLHSFSSPPAATSDQGARFLLLVLALVVLDLWVLRPFLLAHFAWARQLATLRARPYHTVLDNLLTAVDIIIGGILWLALGKLQIWRRSDHRT